MTLYISKLQPPVMRSDRHLPVVSSLIISLLMILFHLVHLTDLPEYNTNNTVRNSESTIFNMEEAKIQILKVKIFCARNLNNNIRSI